MMGSKSNPPIEAEWLTSTASYQTFLAELCLQSVHIVVVGRRRWTFTFIMPRWAAERQHHFGDSTDIKDVFQDYVNLIIIIMLV